MPRHLPQTRDKSGYLSEDTIAALTTSVGGAIAVVRVSGPRALEALAFFAPDANTQTSVPRKLYRARLQDPDDSISSDRQIDDALYVRFLGPESFTGEDVVEFHVHGGAFIASRLLEALFRAGIRQALPGEFSFRAVRNGKMTLSQASAVADLIGASNSGAVSLALEKLSGTQNRLLESLSTELRRLCALGEVGIDFSDQDVDEVSLPNLKKRLKPLSITLDRLLQSFTKGSFIQNGIRVAFIGLPNAGKSSFFNALLGEDRSIVSDIPGTTRDVVREQMTLRGSRHSVTLRLEDTAGLRHTNDDIERMGIDRTQKAAREADVLLLLVDVTSAIEPAIEQWQSLGAPGSKSIGILSKTDRVDAAMVQRVRARCASFGIQNWISTSSLTGDGISESVEAITEFCAQWVHRDPGEVVLTRLEQADSVSVAIEHLRRAEQATEIDLFASDIRQTLHALGPLIGETLTDDILGQIFSEFCIGK